jgi:hypothetical protein
MTVWCAKCNRPQTVNSETRLCSCGSMVFNLQPMRPIIKRSVEFTARDLEWLKSQHIAVE